MQHWIANFHSTLFAYKFAACLLAIFPFPPSLISCNIRPHVTLTISLDMGCKAINICPDFRLYTLAVVSCRARNEDSFIRSHLLLSIATSSTTRLTDTRGKKNCSRSYVSSDKLAVIPSGPGMAMEKWTLDCRLEVTHTVQNRLYYHIINMT